MSFGTGSWALSPYGGAIVSISISKAVAVSRNSVLVYLDAEPMHRSRFADGDCQNTATWSIVDDTTSLPLTIIGAEYSSGNSVTLYVLDELKQFGYTYTVSSTTLKAANGIVISPPTDFTFKGVNTNPDPYARIVEIRKGTKDLANSPTPAPVSTDNTSLYAGTLVRASNGDYANVSGPALVRKLIIRRLTTPLGGFFHLPEYGIDLPVKGYIGPSQLITLRAQIREQVLLEPEVAEASIGLSLDTDSVLTVQVRAKLRQTGEEVQFGLKVT